MSNPGPQHDAALSALESDRPVLKKVVGYLNFSEGAPDTGFLQGVSNLYASIESRAAAATDDAEAVDAMATLAAWLAAEIDQLEADESAFADCSQARTVLALLVEFRTEYREFHGDLLWGLRANQLWRPFFFGRAAEAILSLGPDWSDGERIITEARDRLDDYLGYRPIAVLEGDHKIEPYRHEWIRPIPLYIEGAGVAHGKYAELIERTLAILRDTDADLQRAAWFDPELLEELAVDPRAYDFDHPAGQRPNHHFGQWDPNRIDNRGFYRRFVLQPIALNSLLARVDSAAAERDRDATAPTRDELMFEAAAVLAGVMLMASGTSGDGPGRHDSDVTLSSLVKHIAEYRDEFYQKLLRDAQGPHGERLRAEAEYMKQPLAGARQHLNQEIGRLRGLQMQQVRLAQLFARMGYPEAARERARSVRVASARMLSQIYCRLTSGHRALDRRDLDRVGATLPEVEDLLHRGIECGALVDPWNILAFGGNFSLFPALENSVRDYRIDDLIQLVEQVLDLCSRAWAEAAAVDDAEREAQFKQMLTRLAEWWDQFGSSTVSGLRRLVGKEIEVSTNLVAGALNAWHKAGAAAGDIGFWRLFVEQFDSPKAFQLVIEALLDQGDLVASSALMMQWVSQSQATPLDEGDACLYPLAERWLKMVADRAAQSDEGETDADQWPTVAKFFAHLEASAEDFWHAPRFELDAEGRRRYDRPVGHYLDDDIPFGDPEDFEDDDDEDGFFDEEGVLSDIDEALDDVYDSSREPYAEGFEDDEFDNDFEGEDELDNLFSAAYEDVTFRDTTDDGMESSIYDPGEIDDSVNYDLEAEVERISGRLALLATVARLWKRTAIGWGAMGPSGVAEERRETFLAWQQEATSRYNQLVKLLEDVHAHRIPAPRGTHESMVEYDRRRVMKDSLLEQAISTCVEMSDAARLLRAGAGPRQAAEGLAGEQVKGIALTIEVLRSVLAGNPDGVRTHWDAFRQALVAEELLYIPLSRGGDPKRIVKARALHQLIQDLSAWLPRLGLVREACDLLDVAQTMESEHPVGRGAVTEYDHLFESGYESIVRCIAASADGWDEALGGSVMVVGAAGDESDSVSEERRIARSQARPSDAMLVQALQDLTESQLERWLRHSRTVRLSVVEKLSKSEDWRPFIAFCQVYGGDLFTQRFLCLGNLRAILHQKVEVWLKNLLDERGPYDNEGVYAIKLLDDIGEKIQMAGAAKLLTIAIESVVENYREYRDYNSSTTQSDNGEMLYAFVDFIKLRAAYDRIAWNLKPVFLAHKILIRNDRPTAAELWRRAVAERTEDQADEFQKHYKKRCERYGMRLASVAQRLSERFIRPLAIDRLQALVEPAMAAIDRGEGEENSAMQLMQQEIEGLIDEPCGVGLDAPDWIEAIEEEVGRVRLFRRHQAAANDPMARVPQAKLSWEELQEQLGESEADEEGEEQD